MPRPKLKQTKHRITISVSPDTLSYISKLAQESNRSNSNVIEYIIYQHSSESIPEPIPYNIGAPKAINLESKPKALVNDSIAKISNPDPTIPTEIKENPYAKDE
jgi:hypothetical protein